MPTEPRFAFDNSYARELEGFYLGYAPERAPQPSLVKFNAKLAEELGLDPALGDGSAAAEIFSGSRLPEGASPIAQAYAGHQFGGFSPQLGDGRAVLLGEIVTPDGRRFDIQLKGAGRTPFGRNGDGKAALGPMLREYLISEAMAHLGIPTTRALAVALTGETIFREKPLPGAVLTRIAASHIRIGTFQFFAARGQVDKVKQLADYTIARHFPDLVRAERPYLELLSEVRRRQARLVARWQQVGFIHGVMNTDNAAVSGETIDYGPCAFMDAYDPRTVFSSIDYQSRYSYGNQPHLAAWNLARFAETLLPLIDADEDRALALANASVQAVAADFTEAWTAGFGRKLGLVGEVDAGLIEEFLALLAEARLDFTLAFRNLAKVARGEPTDFFEGADFSKWLERWRACQPSAEVMNRTNPIYIPRNHLVEEALAAAAEGDLKPFDRLLDVLAKPFEPRAGLERYAKPAEPDPAYRTFCGT